MSSEKDGFNNDLKKCMWTSGEMLNLCKVGLINLLPRFAELKAYKKGSWTSNGSRLVMSYFLMGVVL